MQAAGTAKTHRSHQSQIPMQSFRRMQKSTVDTQTIHSRLNLATDLPTLSHAADHQLARFAHTARNQVHRSSKVLLRSRIRLVEMFKMRECGALGGHDMNGSDNRGHIFHRGRWGNRRIGRRKRPCRHQDGIGFHGGQSDRFNGIIKHDGWGDLSNITRSSQVSP